MKNNKATRVQLRLWLHKQQRVVVTFMMLFLVLLAAAMLSGAGTMGRQVADGPGSGGGGGPDSYPTAIPPSG